METMTYDLKILDNSKCRKTDKGLSACLQAIRISILRYVIVIATTTNQIKHCVKNWATREKE